MRLRDLNSFAFAAYRGIPTSISIATSFGDTLERLRFVPVRPQTHGRRIVLEFAVPVAPGPVFFRELSGSPTFPENPCDHSPMFLRPRCDQARLWVQV